MVTYSVNHAASLVRLEPIAFCGIWEFEYIVVD